MFQAPRAYSTLAPADAERQSERATQSVVRLSAIATDLGFIWRRRSWIIFALALALLADLGAELTFTPRYRAVSQILIGPVDLQGVDKSVVPTAQTADANVIEVESE